MNSLHLKFSNYMGSVLVSTVNLAYEWNPVPIFIFVNYTKWIINVKAFIKKAFALGTICTVSHYRMCFFMAVTRQGKAQEKANITIDYSFHFWITILNYGINFGNAAGTLRWNHLFGSRMFANTSLVFNDYHLALSTTQGKYYALLFTAINDYTAKTDLTFIPNPQHQIKLGASFTHHRLYPAGVSAKIPKKGNRLTIDRKKIQEQPSDEAAVYLSDEWKATDNFSISAGLRAPFFRTGTKTYAAVEPRLTAKLSLDPNASVKASWTVKLVRVNGAGQTLQGVCPPFFSRKGAKTQSLTLPRLADLYKNEQVHSFTLYASRLASVLANIVSRSFG